MLDLLIAHAKRVFKRRSSRWRALEREIVAASGECAACPNKSHLQAHHVLPFHLFPALELERANVIVLCEAPGANCHLRIGHGGAFAGYNPNVVRDAAVAKSDSVLRGEVIAEARAARKFP